MSIESDFLVPGLILISFFVYYGFLWSYSGLKRQARGLSLPPGPKANFLTGNLNQLSRTEPWLTYASWSKVYGPIVYFRVFSDKTIVLNSAKVALELLESRSLIYSDRPTMWMAGELAGRRNTIFFTSFSSPRFKPYRRLLQSGLNSRASKTYRPIQYQEAQVLLKSLADSPEDFAAHIRRNSVAIILKVAYGYQVEGNDDQMIRFIEDGFRISGLIFIPGKYWVENFPLLRFLPDWFPGAGFKRVAKNAGKVLSHVERMPFEWAKKRISDGDYVESFISKHIRFEDGQFAEEELQDYVKWCSAGLYVGGGDTTVSVLTTFFLLMALYPDVQRRAQSDIDQLVSDRLPTFDDYDSLPYIIAIIKEVIRWGPVAPLGISHRVMEDDIYENYFIPKGTRVMANIWAITHDEDIYPNPNIFDPSRHLGDNPQPDPFKFIFGFGRRVCPGAHLAEMTLFLNMSNILAVFNVSKPFDKDGMEVDPNVAWTTGVTMHLKPFECQIKPRSKQHLMLIGREF